MHDLERPLGSRTESEADGVRRQLLTVTELARDLAGRFELQPLLARILNHTVTLLGCESGSICLVDEANGTYTKKVDFGVGCQEGQTFSLEEGVTGEVVRSRSTVLLHSYSTIAGGHIAPDDPRWDCAVIGVPIQWDNRIVGTCVIFSADRERLFTTTDARIAELFASHAGIALANSHLHAKASERISEAAVAVERERAVRDVYEAVGHSLGSLLLSLDAVQEHLPAGSPGTRHVASARASAHVALAETRRTVLGLGPLSLEGRTLEEAIASELSWVTSMCAAATDLTVIGNPRPLTPELAHQVFKITQEALSNVVFHARAKQVRVGLVFGAREVSVLVEDDGRGFDLVSTTVDGSPPASGRLGLHGMTSRAIHLGGLLDIDSVPGWGTKVRATIPDGTPAQDAVRPPRWRVLIANDQPLVTAGLTRLLNIHEPAIQVAAEVSSVEDLLAAHQLLRPDVVLVDLDMIHQEKSSVLDALREADPAVAIVVLTNDPTVDQIRATKQAGVRGYINRRSSAETIVRIIVAAGQGQALIESDMFDYLTEWSQSRAQLDNLTPRELEVRDMVVRGMADKQVATALQISVKTVEKHVGSLLRKTGARNRTMLVSMDRAARASHPGL